MPSINSRLSKLEEHRAKGPTHEEALEALLRYENPPAGYTAELRSKDMNTLCRDAVNLTAAGLGED